MCSLSLSVTRQKEAAEHLSASPRVLHICPEEADDPPSQIADSIAISNSSPDCRTRVPAQHLRIEPISTSFVRIWGSPSEVSTGVVPQANKNITYPTPLASSIAHTTPDRLFGQVLKGRLVVAAVEQSQKISGIPRTWNSPLHHVWLPLCFLAI